MRVLRILLFALSVSVSGGLHAAEKTDLKEAWRAQTKDLQTIADKLSGYLPDPGNPQARQELFDFIYSNIAIAYFGVAYSDPAYPDFYPALNQVFRVGWPNPDDAYYYVPVDDDGVYKISGYRGTVRLIDFQISAGMAAKDGTGLRQASSRAAGMCAAALRCRLHKW